MGQLPGTTLTAFRDHGRAEDSLGVGIEEAQFHLFALAGLGIDPGEIGDTLQVDGVRIFVEAHAKLLAAMV